MSSYGALTLSDIGILESVMTQFKHRWMWFLEIGIHTGSTARGIKQFCEANDIALKYSGIDNGTLHRDQHPPFAGAHLVIGDSREVFHHFIEKRDVIFIDGSHARNDVILDAYNYSHLVADGGFLIFHDTSPEIQQTMREAYGPDIPQFYNSVNEALEMMRWPWPGWKLWAEGYEEGQKFGGMTVFQKERP